MAMPPKKNLSKRDYEFMHSLSAAVLQVTPRRSRIILFFWVFTVMTAIVWASFAQIDEIVRGEGEIIPSSENQMIQNLEGGIVEEILVNEGEHVEVGQRAQRRAQQHRLATMARGGDGACDAGAKHDLGQ